MPGIGVLANVAAVALGGILGLGCGRLITERFQNTIMRACALAVLFLGLGGALREMFQIGADGRLALIGVNMMLASLIGAAESIHFCRSFAPYSEYINRDISRGGASCPSLLPMSCPIRR